MLNSELTIVSIDSAASDLGSYRVQASVSVTESDINLLPETYASINWGDGVVEPVDVGTTNLVYSDSKKYVYSPTLEGNIYHDYQAGQFSLVLNSFNLRSPTQDTVAVYDSINLSAAAKLTPTSPVIIGPILPADNGFPNQQQWNLNTDSDLRLLASNVKMILITNIGERLYLPTYGTSLRQILFTPNDGTTQAAVSAEITRAISAWEPRVKIQSVSLVKSKPTVSITVGLLSLLSQQYFTVSLPYLK